MLPDKLCVKYQDTNINKPSTGELMNTIQTTY